MDPDYRALELAAVGKAEKLWATFNASERRGAQFGMFPADKMQAAMAEGHDCRALAVAIMRLAERGEVAK